MIKWVIKLGQISTDRITPYAYSFSLSNQNYGYTPFCRIDKKIAISGGCLISDLSNTSAERGGLWYVNIKKPSISEISTVTVTNLADFTTDIRFGYYETDDSMYVVVYVESWRGGCGVTVISNLHENIEFAEFETTYEKPEGYIEIPVRVLQDEDQVRKIVQEELAKINK